ncbi:Reverse transcriptase (RNA-dependent DNA polymerase) [Popillia japonica]|uniref:Reverse transcriptase (RNA-dependent DNA polymerase) n=1 Tax=Popillia japonica TaxID=7064 RepID=A0AAW1IZB7_POPJA
MTFFNSLQEALADVDDYNIYNYDETNVTDDSGSNKVVVPRSTKRVERVQSQSRTAISIMVYGNARGDLLPPMVVYKASNIYCLHVNTDPKTYEEAITDKQWRKAIEDEIKAHEHFGTWVKAELPKNKIAIDTKWIFRTKQDNVKKARLVARAFQEENLQNVYAPVARMSTIETCLLISVLFNLDNELDIQEAVRIAFGSDSDENIRDYAESSGSEEDVLEERHDDSETDHEFEDEETVVENFPDMYYESKNGYKWKKLPPSKLVRRAKQNVLVHFPGVRQRAKGCKTAFELEELNKMYWCTSQVLDNVQKDVKLHLSLGTAFLIKIL